MITLESALAFRDELFPDREIAVWDDKENGCWWASLGDDHWDEAMDKITERGDSAASAVLAVLRAAMSKP